jgi:HEAT repeat protein
MAGHAGDIELPTAHISHADPTIRMVALSALSRLDALTDEVLVHALQDEIASVRARALQFAALRPHLVLVALVRDTDPTVVEVAAWACGEQETTDAATIEALCAIASGHDDALCRESAVAALGAIGHDHGKSVVLAAMSDKATVRRRAVLALAAFDGEDVLGALETALTDRDWQVRQGAEDLLEIFQPGDST